MEKIENDYIKMGKQEHLLRQLHGLLNEATMERVNTGGVHEIRMAVISESDFARLEEAKKLLKSWMEN